MTKPRGKTKTTKLRGTTKSAGVPVHHVRNESPRFVTLADDKKRPAVLHISLEDMYIRKKGLTQENVENVKRLYCEELDRAFKLYRNQPEKRDR